MIGISFFFRPLGAIVAGHLGDRYGRKKILVLTLILMGAATSLIGVLPTYAAIGIGAPILLVLLRVIQGFSAGGEWGGVALMAVEHAPKARRGYFGAFPQIGVPIGMILATGLLYILRVSMTPEQFQAWGWRIPFLLSVVLILVGYMIRRAVEESPVFKAMAQRKASEHTPLKELMTGHLKPVMQAALIFVSNNAAGYQLGSGRPVMAVGGFNGTDPAPTLAEFQRLVADGRIHYFLGGAGMSGSTGSDAAQEIAAWVGATFTVSTVDGVAVYDLTAGAQR
jgi:MFS family permease